MLHSIVIFLRTPSGFSIHFMHFTPSSVCVNRQCVMLLVNFWRLSFGRIGNKIHLIMFDRPMRVIILFCVFFNNLFKLYYTGLFHKTIIPVSINVLILLFCIHFLSQHLSILVAVFRLFYKHFFMQMDLLYLSTIFNGFKFTWLHSFCCRFALLNAFIRSSCRFQSFIFCTFLSFQRPEYTSTLAYLWPSPNYLHFPRQHTSCLAHLHPLTDLHSGRPTYTLPGPPGAPRAVFQGWQA